jgi:hypothetical protein
MAEIANKIGSGNSLWCDYHIHERTGTVLSTDTRSETEVSGQISGGGGYSSGGTGSNLPVSGSVQSKTTRFQNIFLKDGDGDEHTIELENFLVPCKEDHKLTLFIVKSGNNLRGPYYRAYNHNTREHYENAKAVSSEMFPWREFIIGTGGIGALGFLMGLFDSGTTFGGAVLVAIVTMVIVGIVLGVVGKIVGAIRGSSVRKNQAVSQFIAKAKSG